MRELLLICPSASREAPLKAHHQKRALSDKTLAMAQLVACWAGSFMPKAVSCQRGLEEVGRSSQ